MSVPIILALLFSSLALVGYALISSSVDAWERHSTELATTTETRMRRLFLFADARRLVALHAMLLVAVPGTLFVVGQPPLIVLGALVAVIAAPRLILARLAVRRRRQIDLALPDALAQVAGAMRAGSTFTTAMQSMVEEQNGPLGQEFGLLLREQRLGARLEEALDNLGERVQSEEMDLVISATLIAQEVGGNLAEILGRLSETIRRKLEMEGKIRALTAQGILQGRVVTALPFAILMALLVIEPAATRPIFSSLLGWCFLAVIVLMQTVGALLIGKIVRIEV